MNIAGSLYGLNQFEAMKKELVIEVKVGDELIPLKQLVDFWKRGHATETTKEKQTETTKKRKSSKSNQKKGEENEKDLH